MSTATAINGNIFELGSFFLIIVHFSCVGKLILLQVSLKYSGSRKDERKKVLDRKLNRVGGQEKIETRERNVP